MGRDCARHRPSLPKEILPGSTGPVAPLSAAEKIRARLGWEPGTLNGAGGKPKGVHWRTFERLRAEHGALIAASLAGMMPRFGR